PHRRSSEHDELPSPAGELPLAADALPLPAEVLPSAADALPSPAGSGFSPSSGAGSSDARLSLEPIPAAGDRPSYGELELPLGSDPFASPRSGEADLDLPPIGADPFAAGEAAHSAADASISAAHTVQRRAGGGTSFGEVDLGGGDEPAAEVALDDVRPRQLSQSEEDMEFGAIPQEEAPPAPATAGASQVRMHVGALPPEPAKSSRGVKVALGFLVLVSVGGGALALVPELGPFGYYAIGDALNAGEYEKLTERAVADARQL